MKRAYTQTSTRVSSDCPEPELSHMVDLLFGEGEYAVIDNIDYNRRIARLNATAHAQYEAINRFLRNFQAGRDILGDVIKTPEEQELDAQNREEALALDRKDLVAALSE